MNTAEEVVALLDQRIREVVREELGVLSPANAYTVAAAATVLGCSTRTIRRRIADGEIEAIRIGRMVRIPAGELRRLRTRP